MCQCHWLALTTVYYISVKSTHAYLCMVYDDNIICINYAHVDEPLFCRVTK